MPLAQPCELQKKISRNRPIWKGNLCASWTNLSQSLTPIVIPRIFQQIFVRNMYNPWKRSPYNRWFSYYSETKPRKFVIQISTCSNEFNGIHWWWIHFTEIILISFPLRNIQFNRLNIWNGEHSSNSHKDNFEFKTEASRNKKGSLKIEFSLSWNQRIPTLFNCIFMGLKQ